MSVLRYTTAEGVRIYVESGNKSQWDFVVTYQEPGKRLRAPKHVHLIVDLFIKRERDPRLTNALVDHFLTDILSGLEPVEVFPPPFQRFKRRDVAQFQELDGYGDYSVEFFLAVGELVAIQEKTNYPDGTLSIDLYGRFLAGRDIFSVLSPAAWRGNR